jgi:hypothetical protein
MRTALSGCDKAPRNSILCVFDPEKCHPACKTMGAGSGYTIWTGLFIGLGGILGYLLFFVAWIPAAAVAPILVFIGLEVISQAFLATPARHSNLSYLVEALDRDMPGGRNIGLRGAHDKCCLHSGRTGGIQFGDRV